jgi:hypothetical protein
MRVAAGIIVALCVGVGGLWADDIFSDGFESGDYWGWSSVFGWRVCDVFVQNCGGGESCYLLVTEPHYPTACFPAVPEPDPPSGCGTGLPRPGWQGECCSYINTCDRGLGCLQHDAPVFDHFVCAMYCDPTGTVGPDNCFSELGPTFWCLSINEFYSDIPDLEGFFGFCVDDAIWGPPSCWNNIQDPDEDGPDCCIEPGGNPDCECVFECLP